MSVLDGIEGAVFDKLLARVNPALQVLRAQREQRLVVKCECTGLGLFTEFGHPPDVGRLQTIEFGAFRAPDTVACRSDRAEHRNVFIRVPKGQYRQYQLSPSC